MTQVTQTRLYDQREQFEAEATPLVEQLQAVCEKLGVPLIIRAWIGGDHDGVHHRALVKPNREEVHASFCTAVNDIKHHTVVEKLMALSAQIKEGTDYYRVTPFEIEGNAGFSLESAGDDEEQPAGEAVLV